MEKQLLKLNKKVEKIFFYIPWNKSNLFAFYNWILNDFLCIYCVFYVFFSLYLK